MRGPTLASTASTQSSTPPNCRGAGASMAVTLTDGRELQLETDVHRVADPFGGRPFALAESEIEALEARGSLHDRRRACRRQRERDGHGFRHATDRQFPGCAPAVPRALEARGVIPGLRLFRDAEEVRAAQDLVTLAVLRIDGSCLHGHVELPLGGLRGVEVKRDLETPECSRELRVRLYRRELERARGGIGL